MITHTVRYVRRGSKQIGENRQDHKAWKSLIHKVLRDDLAPSAFKRKRFKPFGLSELIKQRLHEPWVELIWINDRCIFDQRVGLLVPEEEWTR